MKKFIPLLLCLLAPVSVCFAQTGLVTVNGSNVVDSTGSKLTNGTIYFAPVGNNGASLSYKVDGKGQAIDSAVSANVTNGAFSLSLADTSVTSPLNVCFNVTIINNVSGQQVLGSGYTCVQPVHDSSVSDPLGPQWCAGGTCNFDNYVPSLSANLVTDLPSISIGSVTGLSAGATPTASFSGSSPDYILNLGIPAGAAATVSIGSIVTGAPGTGATITNSGSGQNAILNFTIPSGADGTISADGIGGNWSVSGEATNALEANEMPRVDVTYPAFGTGCSNIPADPTGTNDSTCAINAAITYAETAGRGTGGPVLYFPQGVYKITSALRVPCTFDIAGDGRVSTYIEQNTATANTFTISTVGSFPIPNQYTCEGSIHDLTIYSPLGNYSGTGIEIHSSSGYTVHDVRISNTGRGLNQTGNTERFFAYNNSFDTVRWPIVVSGSSTSESHYMKTLIAAPGETLGGCFSINCATNNAFSTPNLSWNSTSPTLIGAVGNGTTATFTIQCNSGCGSGNGISPVTAGNWFWVSGIGDIPTLNGVWKVASVQNNYPVTGDFTVTTTTLETGGNSAVPLSIGPDQKPMVLNPTPETVTGTSTLSDYTVTATTTSGSATVTLSAAPGFNVSAGDLVSGTGIPSNTRIAFPANAVSYNETLPGLTTYALTLSASATASGSITMSVTPMFQPVMFPDFNNAIFFNSVNGSLEGNTAKSLWYGGAVQIGSSGNLLIARSYFEGYPVNGKGGTGAAITMGGYLPYTAFTSAMTCSSGSTPPCTAPVISTLWFANFAGDATNSSDLTDAENHMVIAPQDYNPNSTATSAYVSGVQQNQYEVILVTFANDGQAHILARNQTYSTAPSNTAWPSGSLIGEPNNWPGYSGPNAGSILGIGASDRENHNEAFDPPAAQWAMFCDDNGPFICGGRIVGATPDYVMFFPEGSTPATGTFTHPSQSLAMYDTENTSANKIQDYGTIFNNAYQLTQGAPGTELRMGQVTLQGIYSVNYYNGSTANFFYNDSNNYTSPGYYHWDYDNYVNPNTNGGSISPAYTGRQHIYNQSECWYDSPVSGTTHATSRWCNLGGAQNTGTSIGFEHDYWSGTAWVKGFSCHQDSASDDEDDCTMNKLTLNGSVVTVPVQYTASITSTSVAADSCSTVTGTATGASTGEAVAIVSFTTATNLSGPDAWISAANTLSAKYCNPTASAITLPTGNIVFKTF